MVEVCAEVLAAELRAGLREAITLVDGSGWPETDSERRLLQTGSTNEVLSLLLTRVGPSLVCETPCTHTRLRVEVGRRGIVTFPRLVETDAAVMLSWTTLRDITWFAREVSLRGLIEGERQVYYCNRPNQGTLVSPRLTSKVSANAAALLQAAQVKVRETRGLGHAPVLRLINTAGSIDSAREQLNAVTLSFFGIEEDPLTNETWAGKGEFRPNLLSSVASGDDKKLREIVNSLGKRDALADKIRIVLQTIERRESASRAVREHYASSSAQSNSRTLYEAALKADLDALSQPLREGPRLVELKESYWTALSSLATWGLLSDLVRRNSLVLSPRDKSSRLRLAQADRDINRAISLLGAPPIPDFMGQLPGPPTWFVPHGELERMLREAKSAPRKQRGEPNRRLAVALFDHLERMAERARSNFERQLIDDGTPRRDLRVGQRT